MYPHHCTWLTSERGRQHWQDLTCKLYTECDGTLSKLGAESRRGSFNAVPCVFFGCFDSNYRKKNFLTGNFRKFQVRKYKCFWFNRPRFKIACIRTICRPDICLILVTVYQEWVKTLEQEDSCQTGSFAVYPFKCVALDETLHTTKGASERLKKKKKTEAMCQPPKWIPLQNLQ